MNFEEVGVIIAKLKNDNNVKLDKIISVESDKSKVKESFNDLKIDNTFERFQQIPGSRERDILYICGASGSGKTTYASRYIEEYKKKYKNNGIYLFSSVDKDATLDKIKGLKRIKLNETFLNSDIPKDVFNDTLIIFDDCDVISNKQLKNKVDAISNMLLETGRHMHTTILYTNHIANDRNKTKKILNEMHSLTFFKNLGSSQLNYLLNSSFGFSKKEINNIRKNFNDSRWCTIFKTFPFVCMFEKSIYIVKNEDL
jgi:hypothetical protein